ncbi:Crossover junction endonuclease mus81 [Tulasnella sp. UAMH 9824]|nr:Crossover junction endonuclease mus81 [Tulasnella sp. UAMH 9824]
MPPRNPGPNAALLAVVEDIKNQSKSDNWSYTWNRCARSLREHPTVITCKEDLLPLHGWGSKTADQVWKKFKDTSHGMVLDAEPEPTQGRARKATSNSRSVQAKSSKTKRAHDGTIEALHHPVDLATPRAKRSRQNMSTTAAGSASSQIPTFPPQFPVPQPMPPINQGSTFLGGFIDPRQLDGFGFWYLDERDHHVRSSSQAYVRVSEEATFKVEFSGIQVDHPWATAFVKQSQPGADGTCYGYVSQTVAEIMTDCPGIEILPSQMRHRPTPFKSHAVPLDQRESTLGGPSNSLLQTEFSKAKRKNNSLDPTRMLSDKSAATLAEMRTTRPFPASSSRTLVPEATKVKDQFVIDTWVDKPTGFAAAEPKFPGPVNTLSAPSSASLPTIPVPTSHSGAKRVATMPLPVASSSARRPAPRASNHIPAPRPVDELELELEDSQPRFTPNLYKPPGASPSRKESESTNNQIYSSVAAQNYLQPFQPWVLPARSYDIFMILDIREGRQSNEALIPDLEARGVNIERRPLAIGDVAWIARKTRLDGLGGPQECVLDFIVERKRMDDLVTSVKDGRFHEQKFRLKESGIGQVFYVVEHYQTSKHRESYDKMIDTALSSTQIVDGFKVKETESLKETAAFLAQIHKTLLRTHQNRDLRIIPTHFIRRYYYTAMQKHLRDTQPDQVYLTTWDAFGVLNAKSGLLTTRECWARMLLCVNGLSPEKVAAIIDLYDTPKALWESFAAAEEEEDIERQRESEERVARQAANGGKEKGKERGKRSAVIPAKHMLTRMPNGIGRRKIGAALSEKVYDLFRAHSYH